METDDPIWLLSKAKECAQDQYTAKAWLLTAKTLFPDNFNIQFDAYQLEKTQHNYKAAGQIIHAVYSKFPQEKQLWSEIQKITESLHTETEDDENKFYRELFGSLPSSLQGELVLQIADRTSDILEQCRLMLLVLQRYPHQMAQQGVQLLEAILSIEKQGHILTPVNCYRKYFAYDVLPLVLRGCSDNSPTKKVHRWLQKAIEFYICYLAQPPVASDPATPMPDVMSPTRKGMAKRPVIPGLTEKDSLIVQPWERLFELMRLAGVQLGWNMKDLFIDTSRDSQWQQLNSLFLRSTKDEQVCKQVLLCTCVLLFEALHQYSSRMDPSHFSGGGGTSHQSAPLVLIEQKSPGQEASIVASKQKRLKPDVRPPQIVASSSISSPGGITDSFLMAVKCWEMLHSTETLTKEFKQLCTHWHAESWTWFNTFQADMLIYQGHLEEAVGHIQKIIPELSPQAKLRAELQIASCHHALGNTKKAVDPLLQVVQALPAGSDISVPLGVTSSPTGTQRQLHLLSLSENDILPYAVNLLMSALKNQGTQAGDLAVGHMLVLLQYDWPRHEQTFHELIQQIQRQGSFSYNLFFSYMINLDMLEEFAYLKSQNGGKINLDILPTSTKTLAQQRTVTRGVNKGVKEDFKSSLVKQVARSKENPTTVLRQFLTDEGDQIQKALTS